MRGFPCPGLSVPPGICIPPGRGFMRVGVADIVSALCADPVPFRLKYCMSPPLSRRSMEPCWAIARFLLTPAQLVRASSWEVSSLVSDMMILSTAPSP